MDLSRWKVTFRDGSLGPAPARRERVVFDESTGQPRVSAVDFVNPRSCAGSA